MSLDPGLNGTGWATFNSKGQLWNHGVLSISRSTLGSWDERAMKYAKQVRLLAMKHHIKDIYCEYPEFWDTAGGTMVAKKGDLLKLTFLVGCLRGALIYMNFQLVPVHIWKGQLPKDVVIDRIKKLLGEKQCEGIKSHSWDAVGVGLHVLKSFT